MGRNVLGNLVIRFPADSGRLARMVAPIGERHSPTKSSSGAPESR